MPQKSQRRKATRSWQRPEAESATVSVNQRAGWEQEAQQDEGEALVQPTILSVPDRTGDGESTRMRKNLILSTNRTNRLLQNAPPSSSGTRCFRCPQKIDRGCFYGYGFGCGGWEALGGSWFLIWLQETGSASPYRLCPNRPEGLDSGTNLPPPTQR